MRLQLITTAIVVAGSASTSQAQLDEERDSGDGSVDSTVAVYADDDATTVITSMVSGGVVAPAAVTVDAHALIDAVSSASVDVVSAATPRWTENRIELGATAARRFGSLATQLGYSTSGENDWRSHAVTFGAARAFADDNATLQLSYTFTANQIGRARDPGFERSLDVHAAELSLTQVLGKRTLGTVAYTVQRADGYQASPYRYVTTGGGIAMPETHPTDRTRHAFTARVLRVLGERTTADSSYRFYLDGWGVTSHTAQIALTRELTERLDLRLRGRAYYQNAAGFYQESYDAPMRYVSADRELSTFWDASGGVRLAWTGERLELHAKIDGSYYRFLDFARLAGRVALVTGGGVTWRW